MDQDKKKKYFNTATRLYRQVDQDKKKKYFNTETRFYRQVDQDKKKYVNTGTRL